jgi:hypothetical protein
MRQLANVCRTTDIPPHNVICPHADAEVYQCQSRLFVAVSRISFGLFYP